MKRATDKAAQSPGENPFERMLIVVFPADECTGDGLSEAALDKYLYFQHRVWCFQFNKHGLAILHHF